MLIIIYVLYGQSKLKALVANIAMQRIKAVEAADMNGMLCTCKTQWYIMGMLIIITLGMLYIRYYSILCSNRERHGLV